MPHKLSLFFSVLLMPLNWWFEWRKWRLITETNQEFSKKQKWQGFFAGFLTAMLTPGLVGNFIGRSYYSEKMQRSEIIFLTLLGNLSQFIMSIFFGVLSLWMLNCTPFKLPFKSVFIPSFFILLASIMLYIFAGMPWKFLVRFFPSLQFDSTVSNKFKGSFMILSLFRHLIFTLQFALMLHAFGATLTPPQIAWIWQVYLFVTLVPSLFLGKVIIRDSIAVFVLTQAGVGIGSMQIFAASFFVWVINLFFPLLIVLILLRRKIYVDTAGL